MSYANEYQQYGSNPYSNAPNLEAGQGGSGGYGGEYGAHLGEPPLQHETSNYSQTSNYSNSSPAATYGAGHVLSQADFLARVQFTKDQMHELSISISQIGTFHERALSSPDANSSAQLESLVVQTQLKNTQIRDSIKYLEGDALKTNDGSKSTKTLQVKNLKKDFERQLQNYQEEEIAYKKKYQTQIARQFRIVNPDATEQEVKEASEADWGSEGVFQTALRSNRSGQASSVLGAVRARHNELQRIEKTLAELAAMFTDMAQIVEAQDPIIQHTEQNAQDTETHVKDGNMQLDKATKSAARARKLKWWCLLVSLLIILAIALGVGLGVYFANKNKNK